LFVHPPQDASVIPSAHAQVDLLHDWPLGQAFPHAPQFASCVRSTQVLLQTLLGQPPQVQLPLLQICPVTPHLIPQSPQLFTSL
jgi:hypothetical protein